MLVRLLWDAARPGGRLRRAAALALAGVTLGWIAGCRSVPSPSTQPDQWREENAILKAQLDRCREELDKAQRQIAAIRQRQERAAAPGSQPALRDYEVCRIDLGAFTGGKDFDNRPGDDGLRIYLFPIDRDGHTVKRLGAASISLHDLALPAGSQLVGAWKLDLADMARAWKSTALFYGYQLELPWQGVIPSHENLVLRVEFTALDGSEHVAERHIRIDVPPGAAASQPKP